MYNQLKRGDLSDLFSYSIHPKVKPNIFKDVDLLAHLNENTNTYFTIRHIDVYDFNNDLVTLYPDQKKVFGEFRKALIGEDTLSYLPKDYKDYGIRVQNLSMGHLYTLYTWKSAESVKITYYNKLNVNVQKHLDKLVVAKPYIKFFDHSK